MNEGEVMGRAAESRWRRLWAYSRQGWHWLWFRVPGLEFCWAVDTRSPRRYREGPGILGPQGVQIELRVLFVKVRFVPWPPRRWL